MMARASEFSKKVRGLAFARCKGKCEKCGAVLKVSEGEYDHVIPLALTGESTLDNCQVLCRPCHRDPGAKTADDVKRIAKAKRTEAAHRGITAPKQPIKSPGFPRSAKSDRPGKDDIPPLQYRPMFAAKDANP
jgi:5-methylcytosine-specific restriction enzyme A